MEVNAYEIDITEVTVAAYRACYNNGEGPCTLPDGGGTFSLVSNDDRPVTNVTWQQAMMYCVHNNKRLPTEAEWEAAARLREADGSRVVSDYPWGNSDVDCARAVLDQAGCGSDEPQSVGTTPRVIRTTVLPTSPVMFENGSSTDTKQTLTKIISKTVEPLAETTMPTCPRPSFEAAALPPAPVLSRAAGTEQASQSTASRLT